MPGGAAHDSLIHTAGNCVVTGEVCLAHIHEMLAQGDKALAPCAKSVSELTAVCEALRSLAAQNAPALAKQAAVTMDVCNRCEAECRKHEKVHSQCKNCADACAACAVECKKVV
jgi:Cys-rich four helix bundle protein (predicted Tat secretion target)